MRSDVLSGILSAFFVISLSACGKGGPTDHDSVPASSGQALIVVVQDISGGNPVGVPDAKVTLTFVGVPREPVVKMTNGEGEARFETANKGDVLDIDAPGAHPHKGTVLSPGRQVHVVVPNTPAFSAAFWQEAVFGNPPNSPSLHAYLKTVCFILYDELADAETIAEWKSVAGLLTSDADGLVTFAVLTSPERCSGEQVSVELNPSVGQATWQFKPMTVNGYVIMDTGLQFGSVHYARRPHIIMHTMMRVIGFGYTASFRDGILWGVPRENLTDREALALRLVYSREPGTRYPDIAPSRVIR